MKKILIFCVVIFFGGLYLGASLFNAAHPFEGILLFLASIGFICHILEKRNKR